MKKIVSKFLLAGDKFMHELHLKQTELIYSAGGPFPKHRERIQKFRRTGNLRHYIYKKKDKTYFAHMQHILIAKI